MATTYKVLGQTTCGAANTETVLYTVPSGASAILSAIVVCNETASARTYRLAVRGGGATLATKHYLVFNTNTTTHSPIIHNLGITLGALDIVSVSDSVGSNDVSFQAYGAEIS